MWTENAIRRLGMGSPGRLGADTSRPGHRWNQRGPYDHFRRRRDGRPPDAASLWSERRANTDGGCGGARRPRLWAVRRGGGRLDASHPNQPRAALAPLPSFHHSRQARQVTMRRDLPPARRQHLAQAVVAVVGGLHDEPTARRQHAPGVVDQPGVDLEPIGARRTARRAARTPLLRAAAHAGPCAARTAGSTPPSARYSPPPPRAGRSRRRSPARRAARHCDAPFAPHPAIAPSPSPPPTAVRAPASPRSHPTPCRRPRSVRRRSAPAPRSTMCSVSGRGISTSGETANSRP